MAQATPKKVHARNSACQLCGGAYESRHMLRIFGKSGIEKDLPAKIQDACGLSVSEDDRQTKLVCRKCETFVFKVSDFRQKALANIDLDSEQKCWNPVTSFYDHFVPSHFVPSFGHFVTSNSHFVPKNSHFVPSIN